MIRTRLATMTPETQEKYDAIVAAALEEDRLYGLVYRKGAHIASKGSMLAHAEAMRSLRLAVARYRAALTPGFPTIASMTSRGGR